VKQSKALRQLTYRTAWSVAPLVLGIIFFIFMWYPDNPVNPLTWPIFHDTPPVYSVAAAIAITAIAVTVAGTLIYIVGLFISLGTAGSARPLMAAVALLLIALAFMVMPVWTVFYAPESSPADFPSAIRALSWCFLITFGLFFSADYCTLKVYRKLSTADPASEELKFEIVYSLDSILFIDIPVILSIVAAVLLEHFIGGNGHFTLPVEGGSQKDVKLAAEGVLLGLSLGGIALHVMMSQIIFLLLNFRCAYEKFKICSARLPPPAVEEGQSVRT
jgi:hypothetical protein